ncbi:MAG: TatD family hydrolase [Candidatus Nealsonbacteria bacterium]|nr:TatD family hydrolase [Candidatus Nealsonbacteria bacterium]
MLIDTHAHLNFQAFQNDADEIIRRCLDNDVWVVNVGSQLATSRRTVELAEKYPQGVFAAIGLHPIHVTGHLMKNKLDPEELIGQERLGEFNIEDYRKLARSSQRVVAIGEIGLDYYYKPKTKARLEEFQSLQKKALGEQMGLAAELNRPIIFHCRSAHSDLIETLKSQPRHESGGVIHCFTGTVEQAKEYLGLGLYLGFTGIIFRQIPGIDWPEIIKAAPLEKTLVETDAPYLTPPRADRERNEPVFVRFVVEEIAKIKGVSYEEVARITTENARRLFKI